MATYYEQLRDPRWQQKRLEIMQRDGFKCRECDATTKTLNVDHRSYRKGCAPWEYDDADLVTLCEDCHKEVTVLRAELARVAGLLGTSGLKLAIGYATGLSLWPMGMALVSERVTGLSDPLVANGIAEAIHVERELVDGIVDQDGAANAEAIHDLYWAGVQQRQDDLARDLVSDSEETLS